MGYADKLKQNSSKIKIEENVLEKKVPKKKMVQIQPTDLMKYL